MSEQPIFQGEVHPFANWYPMLAEDELQELADDIAANGQAHAIVLDAQGRLVDGRNRLAACERAGIDPVFAVRDDVKTDEQVASLIRSENNRRRNLSTGQQAATDALLLDAMGLRRDGRWSTSSEISRNSSQGEQKAMHQAGFILDRNRTTLLEVAAGVIPISKAYDKLKQEADEAAALDEQMETLRGKSPDLYRQVTEETLSLAEATAAHDARHARELEAERWDLERRKEQASWIAMMCRTGKSVAVAEQRARYVAEWDPALSTVPPDEVSAKRLEEVGKGLIQLAKEWKK